MPTSSRKGHSVSYDDVIKNFQGSARCAKDPSLRSGDVSEFDRR